LSAHDSHAPHGNGLPGPGESVGGYTILRQVGQGGMAVVFEARHQSLGKRVAVKMLLPHHAARADIARRFVREGEAAARLNHPHAVDVTDVGKDARGAPYLVMEYLEGEDLASLLERGGKLGVAQTADILVPVISAIGAAHDLGIVHRDLKPQNIFLARRRSDVVPKVVDFGISKIEAESMKLTGTEALLGTPYYMSPEQAQGASNVDARTDQFAIGVMLYECVAGRRPFDGGSLFAVLAQIIHGTPAPLEPLMAGPDARFEAVVMRALSKNPSQRYRDVRALGAALIPLASPRTQLSYGTDFGVVTDPDDLRRSMRPSVTDSAARRSQSAPAPAPPERATRPRDDEVVADERASARTRQGSPAGAHATGQQSPRSGGALGTPGPHGAFARWRRSPARSRRARIVTWIVGATVALATLGSLASTLRPRDTRRAGSSPEAAASASAQSARKRPPELPVPSAELRLELRAEPAHATLRLDGEPAQVGRIERTLRADGKSHALLVEASGYQPETLRFVDRVPAASVVTLIPLPARVPAQDAAPSAPSVRKAAARPSTARPPRARPASSAVPAPQQPPTAPAGPVAPGLAPTLPEPTPRASAPPPPPPDSPPAPKRYGTNGAAIVR
jgi:eukaryotic-like serine/threonine-protein kinase